MKVYKYLNMIRGNYCIAGGNLADCDIKNNIQNKIFNIINDNQSGISCSDISKKIKVNRVTLAKYLSLMELEGLIYHKEFGMAKVWYINKNPIIEAFKGKNGHNIKNVLDLMGDCVLIMDKSLQIIWANKAMKNMFPEKEFVNVNFLELFSEAESLKDELKSNTIKRTVIFDTKNNQKIRTTISPILNQNNDYEGYINVLNIESV